MRHQYSVVNAFTRESLAGNPVAVFHNTTGITPEQMQGLANQFQLSESTFVESLGTRHAVRIFTPVNELPFAGHPLIGTAVSIFNRSSEQRFDLTTARYDVQVNVTADGPLSYWVQLRFPAPKLQYQGEVRGLLHALGLDQTILPVCIYDAGARHALVAVEDPETLKNLRPNLSYLAHLEDLAINCFTFSGKRVENRMFSPAYGVTEDAATGSAVNAIAAMLHRNSRLSLNQQIEVTQGTQVGRPSIMYGRLIARPNGEIEAQLSGNSRVFADGHVHDIS